MTRTITLLDDATRPKAPKIPNVTPEQRRHGRQLAMIHRLHLAQLEEVRLAMEMADQGAAGPEAVRDAVASLDMATNYHRFGTLCGRECWALTYHHTSEDQQVFPIVRQAGDGIARVVDRLIAEHQIVHQLLVKLAEGATAVLDAPSRENFVALRDTFETLERVVRSHFGYEETELEEAIGVTNVPF